MQKSKIKKQKRRDRPWRKGLERLDDVEWALYRYTNPRFRRTKALLVKWAMNRRAKREARYILERGPEIHRKERRG